MLLLTLIGSHLFGRHAGKLDHHVLRQKLALVLQLNAQARNVFFDLLYCCHVSVNGPLRFDVCLHEKKRRDEREMGVEGNDTVYTCDGALNGTVARVGAQIKFDDCLEKTEKVSMKNLFLKKVSKHLRATMLDKFTHILLSAQEARGTLRQR